MRVHLPLALSAAFLATSCAQEPLTSSKRPAEPASTPSGLYDPCEDRMVLPESPVDGAVDVPIATEIRWAFDSAEQEATLTVHDPAGEAIDGQQGWDGNTLVLRPAKPLQPDTAYTAKVSYSCGELQAGFTTEVIEASTAWEAQLDGGTFVQPAGVGGVMAPLLADSPLLVAVLAEGVDTLDLRLAQGNGLGQEPCAETVEALETDFSMPPEVRVEVDRLQLSALGSPMWVEDAVFTAELDLLYGSLTDVGFSGWVDVSGLDPVLGDVCDLLVAFGTECGPCPVTQAGSCVYAEITQIPTVPFGDSLVERTAYDLDAAGTCP